MPQDTSHVVEGVRRAAWDEAGVAVEGALTAEAMIDAAGLNWEVELEDILRRDHNGRTVTVPGKKLVVRKDTDEVLSTVGSDYVPFLNREVFAFADNIVDSSGAHYQTAGSLRGGKWVWALLQFDEGLQIGGQDPYNRLLLLTTSHDGSKAITAANVYHRVFCENTLNLALRHASHSWTVRHTRTAQARIEMAREALELTFAGTDEFQVEMERLLNARMTAPAFESFADELLGNRFTEENRGKAKEAIKAAWSGSGNLADVARTKYAALQAVGEYFEHERPRTPEGKFVSTMMGQARGIRNRALELLAA